MRYSDTIGFDEYDADLDPDEAKPLRCKRCGSTDVRWRQQGGRWVLFSLTPGVEHTCPPLSDDEFNFD